MVPAVFTLLGRYYTTAQCLFCFVLETATDWGADPEMGATINWGLAKLSFGVRSTLA